MIVTCPFCGRVLYVGERDGRGGRVSRKALATFVYTNWGERIVDARCLRWRCRLRRWQENRW